MAGLKPSCSKKRVKFSSIWSIWPGVPSCERNFQRSLSGWLGAVGAFDIGCRASPPGATMAGAGCAGGTAAVAASATAW
ncbi:Uncharacterised protein [Mycobacteroides abscessus subsp. abscessus]|nr:Uncharacterised protein [Mycobacteroides abscessus subsp. abscessus]